MNTSRIIKETDFDKTLKKARAATRTNDTDCISKSKYILS